VGKRGYFEVEAKGNAVVFRCLCENLKINVFRVGMQVLKLFSLKVRKKVYPS
jgi:hypothetical protein